METILPILLVVAGLVAGLFYFAMCHALAVIADKTGQGEAAQILAYVPGLQILPIIWSGGGSALRCLIVGIALVAASGLVFAAGLQVGGGEGGALSAILLGVAYGATWLVATVYFTLLTWRTAEARGVPGWLGLLVWVPVASMLLYPILAFHDGWQRPHRIGAAIGLLVVLAMTAPFGLIAADPEGLQARMTSSGSWPDAQALAALDMAGEVPVEAVESADGTSDDALASAPATVDSEAEARSIRAMLALSGRFEALDALATAENLSNPTHRQRALALVRGIRSDLEAARPDLDAESYQDLATHLVRVEAFVNDRGRPASESGRGLQWAAGRRRAAGGPDGNPAAPDPAAALAAASAPTRPFPVPMTDSCPQGTELRVRENEDEGDEEWCQQLDERGGLRHGWYAQYFGDGRPRQVGLYMNGLRIGVWTHFHPTGEIRAQAEFEEGLQHGWLLSFAKTGEVGRAVRFDRGAAIR